LPFTIRQLPIAIRCRFGSAEASPSHFSPAFLPSHLSVILAMLWRQVSADILTPRLPVGSAQKPVRFFVAHNQFLLCVPLDQPADAESDVSEVKRVS